MSINCNDPRKPNTIWARDFSKPVGRIQLVAHAETIRVWAEAFGSAAKIGEYCGLVHGVWMGDDDTKIALSEGLLNPTAVFKGLKRPLFNMGLDADRQVYIYITNPTHTYLYPREVQYLAGPMKKLPAPIESVFATYVTFEKEHVDDACKSMSEAGQPQGVVVGWEWLEQSVKTPTLPYDYDSRFEARVL